MPQAHSGLPPSPAGEGAKPLRATAEGQPNVAQANLLSMNGAPAVLERAPSLVDQLRDRAGAIWRGELERGGPAFAGLSSEVAVRRRLAALAEANAAQLPEDDARRFALALPFEHGAPLALLEATEGLLTRHAELTELLEPIFLVQCLAGRVGRWAVRAAEVPDARLARALYRDARANSPEGPAQLIERAAAALAQGAYREAIRLYLEADRLERTPSGLLRVAIALCRLGDHVAALWSIRAALLEPPTAFESQQAHQATLTLEARLRTVVEARKEAPLNPDEAKLLRGMSVRDWVPLHRQVIVDRRAPAPITIELPPPRGVPKAEFRTLELAEPTARNLLPVDELIITEIIPPLLRGEIDPDIFDEPLRLVSGSFELDVPAIEERAPVDWPLDYNSAPPFRAEVRALGPEEATAPSAPEMQPLHSRFSGTSAVALKQTIQKRVYEKTEQIRVRGFEALLLDPVSD